MKKTGVFDYLLSGELFFFLFLMSGQFKSLLPLPIDITLIFALITGLCAARRMLLSKPVLAPLIKGARVLIPYMLLIILMAVSTLWSLSPYRGGVKLRAFLITGSTILAALYILDHPRSLRRFFDICLLYGFILAAQTIYSYFAMGYGRVGFIDALGTSYMQSSRFMAACALLSASFFLHVKGRRGICYFAYSFISMFAILLSGARAAALLLAGFLILLGIFVLLRKWPVSLKKRYFALAAALLIGMGVLLMTDMTATFKYRMSAEQTRDNDEFWRDDIERAYLNLPDGYLPVLSREAHGALGIGIYYGNQIRNWEGFHDKDRQISRLRQLEYALDMIKKQPVRGWGLGSFPVYMTNTEENMYPHNMFAELWAECGIFAFLAFLALLLLPMLRLLRVFFRGDIDPTVTAIFFFALYWCSMSLLAAATDGARMLYVMLAVCCVLPIASRSRNAHYEAVDISKRMI